MTKTLHTPPARAPMDGEVVDRSGDQPDTIYGEGQAVRIDSGDLTRDDDTSKMERSVAGRTGRVSGRPYEAVDGPNKGEIIQPVIEDGTGALVGVPAGRLSRRQGATRSSVGFSHIEQDKWDRIFGKKSRRRS